MRNRQIEMLMATIYLANMDDKTNERSLDGLARLERPARACVSTPLAHRKHWSRSSSARRQRLIRRRRAARSCRRSASSLIDEAHHALHHRFDDGVGVVETIEFRLLTASRSLRCWLSQTRRAGCRRTKPFSEDALVEDGEADGCFAAKVLVNANFADMTI